MAQAKDKAEAQLRANVLRTPPPPTTLEALMDMSRKRVNKKKRRSWTRDFFLTAPPYHARHLRFLFNFPVGVLFGYTFYVTLVDNLLTDAYTDGETAGDVRWVVRYIVIVLMALCFAWSPVLRTIMWATIGTLLTSTGQGVLSAMLAEKYLMGAVFPNLLANFERASDALLCNIHVSSEIASERARIAAEPVKGLMVDLAGGASETRRVVGLMEDIYRPLMSESRRSDAEQALEKLQNRYQALVHSKYTGGGSSPTSEDRRNWTTVDSAISDAAYSGVSWFIKSLFGEDDVETVGDAAKPKVTNHSETAELFGELKSDIARHYAEKLQGRCDAIFDASVIKCLDNTATMMEECMATLGKSDFVLFKLRVVRKYMCKTMVVDKMCQVKNTEAAKRKMCQAQTTGGEDSVSDLISPDLDASLLEAASASDLINQEMEVNIHYKMVEQPRVLRVLAVDDVKLSMGLRLGWVKTLTSLLRCFIKLFVIFLTFKVTVFEAIRLSTEFVKSYMEDVTFENNYLLAYFWKVDKRQQKEQRDALRRVKNYEKREHQLKSPWTPLPSGAELSKTGVALLKFLALSLGVGAVLLTDWGLYKTLTLVQAYSLTEAKQDAYSEFSVRVDGTGRAAAMVRSMIDTFNKTGKIDDQRLDNSHCLVEPQELDHGVYWGIGMLLGAMLVVQVFGTFLIVRLRLLGLMPFMWPQRSKARILHLYNKLLRQRKTTQDLAKQKVRQQTRKKELQKAPDGSLWSFLQELGLLKPKCFLCEDRLKKAQQRECPNGACGLVFCAECWDELVEWIRSESTAEGEEEEELKVDADGRPLGPAGLAERNRGQAYDFTEYSSLFDEQRAKKYCYACFAKEKEAKRVLDKSADEADLSDFKGLKAELQDKVQAARDKKEQLKQKIRQAKVDVVMRD